MERPETPGNTRRSIRRELKRLLTGVWGWRWRKGPRRQTGGGNARNRASAPLNRCAQGQRCGRCKVRRRAERVSRPGSENRRRLSVPVVVTCSPSPMRALQRARLWAITCTASQAALAAKRPEGKWSSPTPYLRSLMVFSISACRRWSASSWRVSPCRSVMKA